MAFADDIVLWRQDKNVEKATEALNRDLSLLTSYCKLWRMQVNAQKTVYTVSSNSNEALQKDLKLMIGNARLSRDDLPRYLGVALDPRLRLTQHIENTAIRATERVALMRKLGGGGGGGGKLGREPQVSKNNICDVRQTGTPS